ncbi:MAG: hypothetical protein JWO46_2976, partial [Nocardioidaceae bacterium]|nr:hypothetical protein [Nocardioidaceae bacterium]
MSDAPYVSRKIHARRPEYVVEVAEVLGEDVVGLVEIDCLRPPLDTLVITPSRVLATTYAEVRDSGEGVFDVPLAEVASVATEGRRHALTLLRTDGEAHRLGNLVDTDADLVALLHRARAHAADLPLATPSDLESQLAQLERIAALEAAG